MATREGHTRSGLVSSHTLQACMANKADGIVAESADGVPGPYSKRSSMYMGMSSRIPWMMSHPLSRCSHRKNTLPQFSEPFPIVALAHISFLQATIYRTTTPGVLQQAHMVDLVLHLCAGAKIYMDPRSSHKDEAWLHANILRPWPTTE